MGSLVPINFRARSRKPVTNRECGRPECALPCCGDPYCHSVQCAHCPPELSQSLVDCAVRIAHAHYDDRE